MPAKQKSGIGAAGGRLFCWPRMRTAALAAAFIVLLAPDALANKPQARRPWLLFPIDVRRFDHVSSRFGMRRLAGHRQLHRGVDLVAPSGSWVVAAREGRVAEAGRARACGWYVTVVHANARSEEHTSELQSRLHLVCRPLLEKKNRRLLPKLGHTEYQLRTLAGNLGKS